MRTTFLLRPTEADHFKALLKYQRALLHRSLANRHKSLFFLLSLLVWGSIGFSIVAIANQGAISSWLLPTLMSAALILVFIEQTSKGRLALRWTAKQISKPGTLTLDDNGLHIEGENACSSYAWSAISNVEVCDNDVLIYILGVSYILLPSSTFNDTSERNELVQFISSHINVVPISGCTDKAASSPAEDGRAPTFSTWNNTRAILKQGLRLAFFLSPSYEMPRVSWSQFILVALLAIVLPIGYDMVRVGFNGSFAWYALPATLYFIPVLLLAAWAISLLAGQERHTLLLLTAMVCIAIPLEALNYFIQMSFAKGLLGGPGRWGYLVHFLPTFWLAAASAVAAIRIFGIPKQHWMSAAALSCLLIVLPFSSVYHGGSLWVEPRDESVEDKFSRRYLSLANEDNFYLQPKLLERQLADLKLGRKGIIDLYFIGVAGYSSQDVFMKEIQAVSSLFKDKFDTSGRSVLLINNPKTVTEYPIASSTSLRLALNKVADVMDREEDILFLFLTSHGSKEHKFSLDFWPMRFNSLDPKRLRELLDESGIKHRVVVVSACYSGGFIDALKDDNTLVIAASAPDKNSFGCDNAADFTYFGKAFFDEALRQTNSFIEAFDIAKPAILERERKEGREPSDPRIHVGNSIQAPLAVLASIQAAPPLHGSPHDGKRKHDIYDAYFNVIGLNKRVRQYRQECLREMGQFTPEIQVANQPDAFGGITPGTRYWSQIVGAWHEYAESWCRAANDESTYRAAFRKAWQTRSGDHEIRKAIEFFSSGMGKQILEAEEDVSRKAHSQLADARAEITKPVIKKLQDEQTRIISLHQSDAANRRGNKANTGQ